MVIRIYQGIFIAGILSVSNVVSANCNDDEDQSKQVGCNVIARINNLGGVNKGLANEAASFINELLKKNRVDQDAVYNFVRTVNRNIDNIEDNDFKNKVRKINKKLMLSSYSDALFQNDNLSNQIKTRMPLLIEDSLKISNKDNEYLREDFLEELKIFSNKYLTSKRFSAGIGLAYSYIPNISYQGSTDVDLSPFQTVITGGADQVRFNTEFSNKSYPSLLLSARVPYATIVAAIPTYEESQTTITPVIYRDIDDSNRDVLLRNAIVSKLKVEYDISVRASVSASIEKIFDVPSSNQVDWGIGVGMVGYTLEDTVSTDVRFETSPEQTFNELPSSNVLVSSSQRSFNSPYGLIYYNFELSDQLLIGADAKFYPSETENNAKVTIDGFSISLNLIWYPTFGFK